MTREWWLKPQFNRLEVFALMPALWGLLRWYIGG